MRVVFDFFGTELGAIGAPSHHVAAYEADTYGGAVGQLYQHFEHVCPLRSWTASVDGVTVAHGDGWNTYPNKEG